MRRLLGKFGEGVLEIVGFLFFTLLSGALVGIFGLPVAIGTFVVLLSIAGVAWWIGRRRPI